MDFKTLLAYAALAYLIASIIYLLTSACCLETPFKNSLTTEQIRIKLFSAKIRREVFCGALVIAIIVLFIFQPFNGNKIKS